MLSTSRSESGGTQRALFSASRSARIPASVAPRLRAVPARLVSIELRSPSRIDSAALTGTVVVSLAMIFRLPHNHLGNSASAVASVFLHSYTPPVSGLRDGGATT